MCAIRASRASAVCCSAPLMRLHVLFSFACACRECVRLRLFCPRRSCVCICFSLCSCAHRGRLVRAAHARSSAICCSEPLVRLRVLFSFAHVRIEGGWSAPLMRDRVRSAAPSRSCVCVSSSPLHVRIESAGCLLLRTAHASACGSCAHRERVRLLLRAAHASACALLFCSCAHRERVRLVAPRRSCVCMCSSHLLLRASRARAACCSAPLMRLHVLFFFAHVPAHRERVRLLLRAAHAFACALLFCSCAHRERVRSVVPRRSCVCMCSSPLLVRQRIGSKCMCTSTVSAAGCSAPLMRLHVLFSFAHVRIESECDLLLRAAHASACALLFCSCAHRERVQFVAPRRSCVCMSSSLLLICASRACADVAPRRSCVYVCSFLSLMRYRERVRSVAPRRSCVCVCASPCMFASRARAVCCPRRSCVCMYCSFACAR